MCIWWDWNGVLYYELLLENQVINSKEIAFSIRPTEGRTPWKAFVSVLCLSSFYLWLIWNFYFLSLWIYIYIYRLCCPACGISVPWPGVESLPVALKAQSLNLRTARKFLGYYYTNLFLGECIKLARKEQLKWILIILNKPDLLIKEGQAQTPFKLNMSNES